MAPSRSIDNLIEAAFAGQTLSDAEIQHIAEHVAAAGFDSTYTIPAGKRLAGIEWHGRPLALETRLPTAEAHYLRHVIVGSEWPAGTALDQYQASVSMMAREPTSGVAVSRFRGRPTISIVGQSGSQLGPRGAQWMLVEYRIRTRYWSTAFQMRDGLFYLEQEEHEGLRWLRKPS